MPVALCFSGADPFAHAVLPYALCCVPKKAVAPSLHVEGIIGIGGPLGWGVLCHVLSCASVQDEPQGFEEDKQPPEGSRGGASDCSLQELLHLLRPLLET